MPALDASERLPDGSPFELLFRLAAGGMGTVYAGVVSGEMEIVAVKRAHDFLRRDAEARRMFIAEASLASKIQHPNVVRVRQVVESQGELMLSMDYIEGAAFVELLQACIRNRRRLSPALTLRVVVDAALGLHAAHELRGDDGRSLEIVHRDVSPHNVLVGLDGRARVVDFGVAHVAKTGDEARTATGVLKGKIAYMAPEYMKGGKATRTSDVFSLAIVAWEALAARRLFKGETDFDTMIKVQSMDVPLVSDVAPIDDDIARVLARALDRDPARRYPTALELAGELKDIGQRLDCFATDAEVGARVEALVGEALAVRRAAIEDELQAYLDRVPTRIERSHREAPMAERSHREAPMAERSHREAPMAERSHREAPMAELSHREAPVAERRAGRRPAPETVPLAPVRDPLRETVTRVDGGPAKSAVTIEIDEPDTTQPRAPNLRRVQLGDRILAQTQQLPDVEPAWSEDSLIATRRIEEEDDAPTQTSLGDLDVSWSDSVPRIAPRTVQLVAVPAPPAPPPSTLPVAPPASSSAFRGSAADRRLLVVAIAAITALLVAIALYMIAGDSAATPAAAPAASSGSEALLASAAAVASAAATAPSASSEAPPVASTPATSVPSASATASAASTSAKKTRPAVAPPAGWRVKRNPYH